MSTKTIKAPTVGQTAQSFELALAEQRKALEGKVGYDRERHMFAGLVTWRRAYAETYEEALVSAQGKLPMMDRLVPVVGQGCTIQIGSDTYAGEVLGVSPSGSIVTLRYSGNREVAKAYKNARGAYKIGCRVVRFGVAYQHLDPHF